MASLLSYVLPVLNRVVGSDGQDRIDIPPVETHNVETAPEKLRRTLKHLLKANHVNHSIIYHNLQFDNHMPHILCSAYLLGANVDQLHHIYEVEAKQLDPWEDSPAEVTEHDWRDFLGDKRYQRAYVDFFEDRVSEYAGGYDWKKVVERFMFQGDEPLVNGLIGGLGHPLIHLGYAYEFNSKEIAMEALGLAAVQYNFLHKYLDDKSYTRPAPFTSSSPTDLLNKLASDKRFDNLFKSPGFKNIEPLFQQHEDLVLEYWNAWSIDNPVKQFEQSQEAAVALLVATVPPGTHSYNFFICHVLTTSHAVRILLPLIPAKFHISLVRQWWLLVLGVYVAELRPKIDPDYVDGDVKGKGWNYVEERALGSDWCTDAHYVKGEFSSCKTLMTWGDVHERYLAAARRKRRVVEGTDSEDNDSQAPQAAPAAPKNTLKNFLFSSPDTKPTTSIASATESRDATPASPTPLRRKSTVSSTQSLPASPPAAAFKPPVKFSRQNSTKSPSTSPDKPKARPTKKAKTEEKGKSADIMSLFSRQAQKNLVNGTANGKSNGKKDKQVLDDIISDPISEDDVGMSKAAASSIVGQNAQKRFKGGSQAAAGPSVTSSQRFMRPPQQSKGPVPVAEDSLRPWSERFAPMNLDELAVHKRKVADVRRWLEDVLSGRIRQRLLVLKGAAGTGKTTTMQLLAKDLGCEILEWRNPAGPLGATHGHQSAASQFEEFLGRGGKFAQLDLDSDSDSQKAITPAPSREPGKGSKRQIILIEEFPNTFMRSSTALTSFRINILQFLAQNTPALATFGQQRKEDITPIVMIISETLLTTTSASADSFTAHRLLGPEISRHPGTAVIEFNAVAPTLLTKALEMVVQKEARKSGRRRTPGPLVLKRLGEVGDIRSAISALEFLMVKGDDKAEWGAKVMLTKPKKALKDVALTKGEQESLEFITQRESSLGIFHAVGKVIYNKRDELPFPERSDEAAAEMLPPHMAQLARKKRSEVNVEALIDETGTDTATFISALHENYVGSCEPSNPLDPNSAMDYVNECIEYLSESDLMCPSFDIFFGGRGFLSNNFGKDSGSHILRQDEMAFQVAVRGLLFSLPSPVKRRPAPGGKATDAFKMFYPTSLKLWRAKEELEGLVDMWAGRILKGEDAGLGPPASTTNGSAAFKKGRQISVNDWASPKKAKAMPPPSQPAKPQVKESTAPPPLLSLGSSARREMLLERLPYMAQIARRRRCSFGSMSVRDLDKMVTFQGIGGPATDEDDADPDEDAAVGETWATDKPTEEETPRKKGLARLIKAKDKAEVAVASLPAQSLVISDDDIEDD
ncbi:cell cycle checkpoint protein RAD17 [Coniochaeta sp. 2T2.1]|nr:cell cycle checkpoint protein RAD17 [Coniochaeta sp. 2T2.1]